MPPLSDKQLEERLTAVGKSIAHPPTSLDDLLSLLDRVEELLSKVEQSPPKSMQTVLAPLMKGLVAEALLKHSDIDVKVGVASCISEITRITAPDAPYDDDKMKDVFQLTVSSFEDLSEVSSRSREKQATILETVAKDATPIARTLVERVIHNSADKLKPYIKQAVLSLETSLDAYSEVLAFVCQENTDTAGHSNDSILKNQPVVEGKCFSASPAQHQVTQDAITPRKSQLKSTKHEVREETPRTSTKRKQTPGKEKASVTPEFGKNLVGSKVKVWWAKDRMFYEGVIDSFDSVKKKHKVLYNDGDQEILNLQKEKWHFLEDDVVSNGNQDVEHSSHDTSDVLVKRKGNMSSETTSKRQKVEGSPKSNKKDTATKSGKPESGSKENYPKSSKIICR